ncbi:MAG TPA: STAS domain-containing protein [Solirubrobacteraceae bacterium]|nr:STAS domain-containing protein [Solirubrobacteraceae bacterium]
MSESFSCTAFVDSGRRVVTFAGELDLARVAEADAILSDGFDVLDVSELEFLDSSGLRVLLLASQDADPTPVLCGASGQVKRILELSGIDKMFVMEVAGRPNGRPPSPLI